MRDPRLLPSTLVALAIVTACTGACAGKVETIGGAGPGSSGSGSGTGSSGMSSSGVSSSSGTTGDDSGFTGFDVGTGDDSTVADGGFGDTSTSCSPPVIPILHADGGMNSSCEGCLVANCEPQECACILDPETLPIDDAGTMAPGCDLFYVCVEEDVASLSLATDASANSIVMTALSDCNGDGGTYPQASMMLGTALIQCEVTMCTVECAP
jgi:hypothetical protein